MPSICFVVIYCQQWNLLAISSDNTLGFFYSESLSSVHLWNPKHMKKKIRFNFFKEDDFQLVEMPTVPSHNN